MSHRTHEMNKSFFEFVLLRIFWCKRDDNYAGATVAARVGGIDNLEKRKSRVAKVLRWANVPKMAIVATTRQSKCLERCFSCIHEHITVFRCECSNRCRSTITIVFLIKPIVHCNYDCINGHIHSHGTGIVHRHLTLPISERKSQAKRN